MSVATLGLEVTSSPVVKAASDLDRLTASAAKAETMAESLGKASRTSAAEIARIGTSVEQTNALLTKLTGLAEQTNAALDKMSRPRPIPVPSPKPFEDTAKAVQLTANQMLNLSRQGNDVITMWALGAQPMQIFASQAGQIYGALEEGPGGVRGSLKALGIELVSLATRFPIATAAIAAAGVAIAAYKMIGGESVRALDDVLKEHESILDRLGPGWDRAKSAAKSYASETAAAANLSLGRISKEEAARLAADVASAISGIEAAMLQETADRGGMILASRFEPFRDLIQQLRTGAIDVLAFRDQVARLAELEPSVLGVAQELDKLTQTANDTAIAISGLPTSVSDAETKLKRLQDAIVRIDSAPIQKQLQDLFDKVKEGSIPLDAVIGKIAELEQQNPSFAGIIGGLRELAREAWLAGEGLRAAADAYARNEGYRNPRRRPDVDLPGFAPIPEARPNAEDILAAQEKAAARADKRDPYADAIRSADARIRQLGLEVSLSGQVGAAAEALRVHQELLNRATADGNEIGEEQNEKLRERARSIAELTEALKQAKLQQDLFFERQQMFRSPGEQQIASRLRGLGLGMDSPEAAYMRDNQRIAELQDGIRGFFDDFRSGLSQGKDIGEAFGDAILNSLFNALNKATDRAVDTLVNSLTDALFPGSKSGAGLFGAASDFVEKGGGLMGMLGGAANDNYAPGAVTRAPLPNVGGLTSVYRDAIASIESAGSGGYSAIGPTHPTLGRALGRYQIMEGNIGPWSKAAIGRPITPGQFLANPSYQDQIFDHRFGSYVGQFGERGAAQAWFGGPGSVGKLGRSDVLGTTVGGYGDKFMSAMERMGGSTKTAASAVERMATSSIDATKGLGQFGNSLSNFFPAAPGAPAGGGGSWLSSLFGGASKLFTGAFANFDVMSPMTGLFHEGGIAGFATQFRPVDPRVFIGAPRYHNGGIAGDEVPAILKRGEPVFKSMEHARQVVGGGGGSQSVHVTLAWEQGSNGNIEPVVRSVSQREASAAARSEVNRYDRTRAPQTAMKAVSAYQQRVR